MNRFRTALAALAAAALLAACGGSDDNKVNFQSVVSFGDSVSDVGTYKVGTIAALGGGKFTVNGGDDKVWTERLAAALGTPAQCAARTGLLPNRPGVTGAPVQDIAACTNYAEGSSRITSEGSGPNGVALQSFGEQNLGLMANSLNEQINRHLAKSGGKFSGSELVTFNGGGDDLFMQLGAIVSAAGGGAGAVAAGTIAGWPQSVLDIVAGGGAAATNAAVTAGVTAMAQAGTELAGYINTLVLGKGATHVVVDNLGDVNFSPFGRGLDAGTQGLITNLIKAFNGQLTTGLAGSAGVLVYDEYAEAPLIAADPAKYGFTSVTDPACGPNAFSVPATAPGPSIVCNASNLVAGDTSKYRFADDVHPTPAGHQHVADAVLSLMHAAGWR